METLFISQQEYDQQMLRESIRRRPVTVTGRITYYVLRICAFACWAAAAAFLVKGVLLFAHIGIFSLCLVYGFLALLTAIMGALSFFARRRSLKRQFKSLQELFGGESFPLVFTFAEQVTVRLGSQTMEHAYDRFGRLSENGETFYLWLDSSLVYSIPKSSFTQGDPKAFSAFILPRLGQLRRGKTGQRQVIGSLLYAGILAYWFSISLPYLFY